MNTEIFVSYLNDMEFMNLVRSRVTRRQVQVALDNLVRSPMCGKCRKAVYEACKQLTGLEELVQEFVKLNNRLPTATPPARLRSPAKNVERIIPANQEAFKALINEMRGTYTWNGMSTTTEGENWRVRFY